MSDITNGFALAARRLADNYGRGTVCNIIMKKFLCLVFSLLLIAGILSPSVVAADIKGYTASDIYMASEYYKNLSDVKLTGDGRYDVLSVALSQLGYHEGNSDDDHDGMNAFGTKNFVEYNRLYGKVDNGEGNGVSYGYAWCASFVSWCLRQANVPVGTATTEISCPRMVTWYKSYSTFKAVADKYSPLPGDVIFFKSESSTAVSSHVGLVRGVKDGKIYTIEGNSGGIVGYHTYASDDTYIIGYGVPAYATVANTDYSAFELVDADEALKPGKYFTTASDGLNVREGVGTSYSVITTLSYLTEVDVSEIKDGWGKVKVTVGGVQKDGWLSMSYTISAEKVVYTVRYDANGGNGAPVQQRYSGSGTLTLSADKPTRNGYIFGGWSDGKMSTVPLYQPGDAYSEKKDITLYAIWTPDPALTTAAPQTTPTPDTTAAPTDTTAAPGEDGSDKAETTKPSAVPVGAEPEGVNLRVATIIIIIVVAGLLLGAGVVVLIVILVRASGNKKR